MTNVKDLRAGADRRRQPRGGRRDIDVEGLAPLVMVVGDEAAVGDAAGAVLAKLRFAVTPSPTVDEALRVVQTMQPDIIVANAEAAARIRLECPEHNALIVVNTEMRDDPQLLVDEIRTTLRGSSNGSRLTEANKSRRQTGEAEVSPLSLLPSPLSEL